MHVNTSNNDITCIDDIINKQKDSGDFFFQRANSFQ